MIIKLQPASQFVKIVEVACVQLCVKCFQLHIFCGIDNDNIMNFRTQILSWYTLILGPSNQWYENSNNLNIRRKYNKKTKMQYYGVLTIHG